MEPFVGYLDSDLFDYFDVDFDFESSCGFAADCEGLCSCFDCCCSLHSHFVVD
jgi:hypothetical protein